MSVYFIRTLMRGGEQRAEEQDSLRCGVEQSVARLAHNQKVAGSSPAPATNSGRIHEPDRPGYHRLSEEGSG